MAEDDIISAISEEGQELSTVAQLIAEEPSIQTALVIMIVGLIGIAVIYRKVNSWASKKRFSYSRPHVSNFVRTAMLPFLAFALITATNLYINSAGLFAVTVAALEAGEINPAVTFAKILDSINFLVIGYTIAHLIPIIITKKEKKELEHEDYDAWFDKEGYSDDDGDLFHKCFKWIPPKQVPEDFTEEEFQKHLKTKEGRKFLEEFRTTKGTPVGSYEKIVDDSFDGWKKSERKKYEKYFENCITGKNQSGRKLKPGVKPEEIFPIDVWREEKRLQDFEPIIPSNRPPGYARKKRAGVPMSAKRIIPIGIFVAVMIGVVSWWGIDLFVLATATGGLAIGIGFALQDTMQNYFAYIFIKKDKVIKEGDRVTLPSGYNGLVYKITPRVTYIRHGLNESLAIIPTKQIVSSEIINYTKEFKLVPAGIEVGVSYLNNPRQVEAVLIKIGKRAMKEVKDARGHHLARQKRCPYLEEHKQSCGCDKKIHVEVGDGPVVRFNNFNDSALDFALRVFVRDYGSQFKMKSDMRVIMYEEFKKYDIRIPWPIRTVYQGDEKREAKEIGQLDEKRDKLIDKYGVSKEPGSAEDE